MAGHHHHHHGAADLGGRRLALAIVVNLGLTVAQIIGGVVSGSLALIADAIHNLSDALALVIAWAARRIGQRPADADMTFGYKRAEVVAALINYTSLIAIAIYLIVEGVNRLMDPQPIDGWIVVVLAGLALTVDAATAALTYTMSRTSLNIRAAFLHNLADALASIGVIIAGSLILIYDLRWVDPALTLMIAAYILWQSLVEIRPAIRILMLAGPSDLPLEDVLARLGGIDGIADIHHVHLWQMQEHQAAFDAHVQIDPGRWDEADQLKRRMKQVLAEEFGIHHSTLELECARHGCSAPNRVGH
ncbi:MAG: cation diffusion facilitator family transporter [Rhodobacteraceae bacterium]|nr:cation diffusion facilitator family transporter [Paracoccaceae bacterium]